jgi:uncharacterized protein
VLRHGLVTWIPRKNRIGSSRHPSWVAHPTRGRLAPAGESSLSTRLFRRHAALALAHPWSILLVALGVLLVAMYPAVRLYTDLRTDLRELLPQNAPSSVALQSLERRSGGFGHLSILVETADPKAGERFVDALTAKLKETLVPKLVREVRSRTDEDRAYVEAHGALYVSTEDLRDLDLGIKADLEKAKVKALDQDLDEEATRPDPRVERIAKKLKARASEDDHFVDGYLASDGGHVLAVILLPVDATTSLADDERLYESASAVVQSLHPTSFDPSIRIGYTGEVREVIEAEEHLIRDLKLSSVLVFGAVGLAIVVFYRRLRAVPLLVGPLLVGTAVTFALGREVIGYLNPNTAFLGSIILGNGINAGIILLARYIEERRAGSAVAEALPAALTRTWRATLIASGAAAASYACLGLSSFRGFNQFAFLGGSGMLLVWLATYAFMPAWLVVFERSKPIVAEGAHGAAAGESVFRPLSRFLVRFAGPIGAMCLAASVLAGFMVVRFARDPIEYDFARLSSRQGAVNGATYWGKRLDAIMQSYLTPTVVLTDSAAEAAAVKRAIVAEKEAEGEGDTIASATTLADVLPSDQEDKLAILRDIKGELTDRVLNGVPAADRAEVETLRAKTELGPVSIKDLPEHVRRTFEEKGGLPGRMVIVFPTLSSDSSHGDRQIRFARTVRAVAERVDPRAQVAGSIVLSADIIDSITHDGTLASCVSLLAVALLTAIVLRSGRHAVFVVGSLFTGVLWLIGAMGLWGIKLNFVNFAVLPITFGIGIDYAVNLYQRYREIGAGGASEAVATTGGAVALCSTTTILGYSALLVADNRAIFSFGLTAVIGELACLSAALIALPVVLILRDRRQLGSRPLPDALGEPLRVPGPFPQA